MRKQARHWASGKKNGNSFVPNRHPGAVYILMGNDHSDGDEVSPRKAIHLLVAAAVYGLMGNDETGDEIDQSEAVRLAGGIAERPRCAGEGPGRARARLRRMVALRLDRRLQGRVDPSDVIQEAYLEAARRLPEYLANRSRCRCSCGSGSWPLRHCKSCIVSTLE